MLPLRSRVAETLVACCFLAALPTRVAGQDAQPSAQQILNASLKGLTSVSVFVNDIDADAARDGLSRSQLTTDIEQRLRQAGIVVVPASRPDGPHGLLNVTVSTVTLSSVKGYVISVQTRLLRSVVIDGINQNATAITWWPGSALAISPGADLATHVSDFVDKEVDAFATAYLSVNPKK